jgi:hypothetical protein
VAVPALLGEVPDQPGDPVHTDPALPIEVCDFRGEAAADVSGVCEPCFRGEPVGCADTEVMIELAVDASGELLLG